jgi:hypothetical protein
VAALADLEAWLAELEANIATGARRSTYMGRTVEFHSLADMLRLKADLQRQIAEASGAAGKPVRVIYTPGQKFL